MKNIFTVLFGSKQRNPQRPDGTKLPTDTSSMPGDSGVAPGGITLAEAAFLLKNHGHCVEVKLSQSGFSYIEVLSLNKYRSHIFLQGKEPYYSGLKFKGYHSTKGKISSDEIFTWPQIDCFSQVSLDGEGDILTFSMLLDASKGCASEPFIEGLKCWTQLSIEFHDYLFKIKADREAKNIADLNTKLGANLGITVAEVSQLLKDHGYYVEQLKLPNTDLPYIRYYGQDMHYTYVYFRGYAPRYKLLEFNGFIVTKGKINPEQFSAWSKIENFNRVNLNENGDTSYTMTLDTSSEHAEESLVRGLDFWQATTVEFRAYITELKDSEKSERFRELHVKMAQSTDKEQLLTFGALMLHRNGHPTRILFIDEEQEAIRSGLLEAWSIMDASTAKAAIHELMSGGRRKYFQTDFGKLQSGGSLGDMESLKSENYASWELTKSAWRAEPGLPSSAVDDCKSMAAYDYERIAYLVRACLHLGYVSEPEMWRTLAWVARQVKAEFANWVDYAVSFVLGRAATFSGDEAHTNAIRAAKELLNSCERGTIGNSPYIWQQYSLSTISKPVDVPESSIASSGRPGYMEAFLGFGALNAVAFEESWQQLPVRVNDSRANEKWLADYWEIADRATAESCINFLLESGSRTQYEQMFRQIVAGEDMTMDVSATSIVSVRHAKNLLLQFGLDSRHVDTCQTLLAYDLERAAYLARVTCSAGYLPEECAWRYLRIVATSAHSRFTDWEAFLISFLYGQRLVTQDNDLLEHFARTGVTLLELQSPFFEYRSPWQVHPLHSLDVLHSVDLSH